jgi:hypothetical protein
VRATFGAGLLLVSATLVGLTQSPVAAATACVSPDTTWTGTPSGSLSWADEANWSDGVPTADSAVCIPYTGIGAGPHVLEGTEAVAEVVTLAGTLTVDTTLDVAHLVGEGGELHGPGTTAVTGSITDTCCMLTLRGGAVVDLPQDTFVDTWLGVWDGSRLNVHGDVVLGDNATIDSSGPHDPGPGFFTIAEGASLTLDAPDTTAEIFGGFANHGEVSLTGEQQLLMVGASPEKAHPDQFSTGTFTGAPDADLWIGSTELRTGARIDHADFVDHITVPAGNTATVAASGLVGFPGDPAPSIHGAGELVVTDGSFADALIGGSLTVTVPADEVFDLSGSVQDNARLNVEVGGELREPAGSSVHVLDDALIDVSGTYRTTQTGGTSGGPQIDDLGTLRIRPGATLLKEGPGAGQPFAEVVNEGTVRVDEGDLGLQLAGATDPSTGDFDTAEGSRLYLVGVLEEHPTVALGAGATLRGSVISTAHVVATGVTIDGADVSTEHTFVNGSSSGSLRLAGTTMLRDGTRLHGAGPIVVTGALESDPGEGGTATIEGARVTGSVRAVSGMLSIPSLAPATLRSGTLANGEWSAAPGATLDLPSITANDTNLTLEGPAASFAGLSALDNGTNGTVNLQGGADLDLPGRFRNEGVVQLSPGSRLITGANFRQFPTGRLVTEVDATGLGRVRAEGRRDLAGELVIQRDPAYLPPVDTVLTFLASNGRADPDDAFDSVVSPKFESRKLRVLYELDHVRLWVDRVG